MSTKFTPNSKNLGNLRRQFASIFEERFLENVPLSSYVSTHVGGVAEYVVVATSSDEVVEAAKLSITHGIDYRVISGGTGTLPSEVGFPGLVIINRAETIAFDQAASVVIASSGIYNQTLLTASASRGLGGIEFLSGVPGRIGGSVATNASYSGQSIGDFVKDVTIFVGDVDESRTITVPAANLGFKPYRSSFLQPKRWPPIILSLRLQLARLPQEEIVRRLGRFRTRSAAVHNSVPQIGGFLAPPIESKREMFREWRRLRLAPGLRLNLDDGVLASTSPKVTAEDYRRAIKAVGESAASTGLRLEERVSYLGYWPAMEEEDTTS